MVGRFMSRMRMQVMNPRPSSQTMFSSGMRTSSKKICTFGTPFSPIFFSFLPMRKPGLLVSIRKQLMPWKPFSPLVRANTRIQCAMFPQVM